MLAALAEKLKIHTASLTPAVRAVSARNNTDQNKYADQDDDPKNKITIRCRLRSRLFGIA
jgi:hypothetical protein